jgi:sulfatase maturation enzyme AslB (radical SAM superfamily)
MSSDKLKFNNPFCSYPFLHQHLDTRKQSKLCCFSETDMQSGFNFNSNEYKEVRDMMLNGDWSVHCQGCQSLEQRKLISPRQKALRDENTELLQHQVDKHLAGELLDPYQYDLRISNLCNLACIMCGPKSSSTIAKNLGIDNEFLSYEPDVYINPKANYMYLAGGEPFLIKKFSALLNKIENTNCKVVINTNGTIVTDHLMKALERFHNVNMTVSIDGYMDLNSKIRIGSNWEAIDKNLIIFKDAGFSLHINTVVQKDNINELFELGTFLETVPINKWTLSELTVPEELRYIQNINKERVERLMTLNLVKTNPETIYLLNSILK